MNQATEKKENLNTKYIQTKDQISLSKMVLVLLVTQLYTGSDVNPKEDFKRTCHKLIKDGSMC